MDIFCKIIKGDIPSYTVYEDDIVKVILDVNPKSDGHSLVIPKKHYKDLFDIPSDDLNYVMEISKKISKILMDKLGCDGITLMENNGISQEVKHFHLHIIPVYEDKNISKVEDVYERIKH